ncbi:LexA family protein [Aeromonas hydrophila]|uniref:LexA family protein n=2 Tax=Aeromonas hydrophila TaxID=644 RepID=UPI00315A1944
MGNTLRDKKGAMTNESLVRGERLKALREKEGLSQAALAEKCGWASQSRVGNYEVGARKISADDAIVLAQALRVRPELILFGSEDATPPTPNMVIAPPDTRRIPVLSYVQAGGWTDVNEIRECDGNLVYITTDLALGERAFAIELKGHSMEPEFVEGDVVLIDPDEHPHPGDFVVAKNGEEAATFKKFRPRGVDDDGKEVFELVPLNDDYPTMRSDRQHIQIIGTMVEHRRRRKRR